MAKFSFFLLASLLGAALAAVPNPVYRADTRGPDTIKGTGGFKSWGRNEDITLIEHASKVYAKGHRQGQDPWISTSGLTTVADSPVVDKPCWVYRIDTSNIASSFTEVAAVYKAAGQTYGHADEQEWAAKFEIPLANIVSFHRLGKDGKKSKTYTWDTWAEYKAEQAKKAEEAKKASSSTKKNSKTKRDGIPW
ncbi:hypothetical protein MFIFM68171_02271 [Madurella fahalii]|uniref:Uncharacterized protein n=1 Tax=Madurella fahalii TaxID=1157608 RepID=A0ABQ0G2T6_9PEZI